KEEYFKMVQDDFQTNTLIDHSKVTILNPEDNNKINKELKQLLISQAKGMNETEKVKKGTFATANNMYYYRMQYIELEDGPTVLASFMDDDYAIELRSSLVDSTFDLTILAFFVILLILMLWVYSIIHPLNQMKYYIEQVKMGKEVELHINREDEIGEVAHELVTLKDELQKQEKAKEEMIHNISHDLKTPIATIKSYAESIKDGVYPYETLEKTTDVIIDNAQRLEDKVHNLLYLNRVEYLLTSDSEGVVTNMKDVVEQVVLNAAVIRPEIEVITEVEEVFFDGLLEAWRVAIENIMENAFRYAKTYIKIEVHENDLRISNDGPHMDESRVRTLFRPFEKGTGGRFGLGLSIVAKVVKANNYKVRGFNTMDGVCFEIYREVKEEKKNERRRVDLRFIQPNRKKSDQELS
ncbi:MAG: HAMP domain-containing histidine kinase, partial [Erysipelotrichaceae bacterium]|nr:HAMP domain-containing histidine kinase [Erysipelotrichaceae bacterium]